VKLYTKKGDDGTTSLIGGARVMKDTLRVETFGTVDELNAQIGVARAAVPDPEVDALLESVQKNLFVLGADIAAPQEAHGVERIGAGHCAVLEQEIDRFDALVPPLHAFILPGGCPAAAGLHAARAVCRRAERLAAKLEREEHTGPWPLIYLNRMSDLLFVLARFTNKQAGRGDVFWKA